MGDKSIGLSWKGYEGRDYEGFWIGPGKQYLDRLEQLIVAHALPGGEAIVDIGAGFGRMGQCYVTKYTVSHMVEPASNLREIARRTYGDQTVRYHDASAYELPFGDALVDTALMVRVFHHFGDPDLALREINRILKPGGRLVFNFSNKRNLKRIILFALGQVQSPFNRRMDAYASTLIGHHPRHVEDMLVAAGFSIEAIYGAGVTDKLVNIVPFLGKILRPSLTMARLLSPMAPAQFVIARKI